MGYAALWSGTDGCGSRGYAQYNQSRPRRQGLLERECHQQHRLQLSRWDQFRPWSRDRWLPDRIKLALVFHPQHPHRRLRHGRHLRASPA